MPVIVRVGAFAVKLHGPPREHPPPHVHVHLGRSGRVIIRLGAPDAPLIVWKA